MTILDSIRSLYLPLPILQKVAPAIAIMVGIPPLAQHLKIPAMVGLLLFGVILGPHVLELFGDNHPVANFFAELGKLLLRGEVVPDALLAHLAPLGWQHINLTGDYLWDPDAILGPDGFRRLRTTSIAPFAAAA